MFYKKLIFMKKLEINQMEVVEGGSCSSFGAGIFAGAMVIGIASGGVFIAVGALIGGWAGAMGFGACLHL